MIPDGWTATRLGLIAHIQTGTRNNQDKVASGSYPFYVRSAQVETIDSYSYDGEAILIPGEGGIGDIFHYVNGPHEVHQRVYRVSRFDPGVVPKFIFFYLQAYFGPHAMRNSVKATVDSLRLPTFQHFEVNLPPPLEQRAIAEALTDASLLVESLNALISKKQDLRLAAVQHYLNPDALGSDAEVVRLGDVIKVEKGELITAATAKPGSVPVIAGGIDPAYFNWKWNRRGLTITISASGANAGYVSLRQGPIWASDCSTISESASYDIRFIAAQLQARQTHLYRAQFGGAQPHVRPKDIEALQIYWLPIELQRQVGSMVADMDAEVAALTAKRDKAQLVKQGMMQELLSGRVRLA